MLQVLYRLWIRPEPKCCIINSVGARKRHHGVENGSSARAIIISGEPPNWQATYSRWPLARCCSRCSVPDELGRACGCRPSTSHPRHRMIQPWQCQALPRGLIHKCRNLFLSESFKTGLRGSFLFFFLWSHQFENHGPARYFDLFGTKWISGLFPLEETIYNVVNRTSYKRCCFVLLAQSTMLSIQEVLLCFIDPRGGRLEKRTPVCVALYYWSEGEEDSKRGLQLPWDLLQNSPFLLCR